MMTIPDQDDRNAAEALERARQLRDRLVRAVASARGELAEIEDSNRRLHDELDLIERSAGRRLILRLRERTDRVAAWARHPLWSASTLGHRLTSAGPASAARGIAAHLLRRTQPLRFTSVMRRWTDNPSEETAVRWLGPTTVRHRTFEALLCHPNSGVEFRTTVVAGSRFACECAIAPHVWKERPAAIDFRIDVAGARGWKRSAALRLDVTNRVVHRRWTPVRLDLPPDIDSTGEEVTVTLATAVVPGGTVEHAWALFGEPRFEWKRPAADVTRSLRAFGSRARSAGVRDALRHAHGASETARDAELYVQWLVNHAVKETDRDRLMREAAALRWQPLISVVIPVYNTDPRWLRACIESIRRQVYGNWELCLCDDASTKPETLAVLREHENEPRIRVRYLTQNANIAGASNAALELARGEFVAFVDHDDELTPDALFRVAEYLNAHPDADMIYSDEDKLDLAGNRCDPYFKPDWAPEHFLTCMYTCHLMVVRRDALDRAGRFRAGYEGAQDYDLVLRLMEITDRIHHIPRILYHWRKLPQSTASAGQAKPWALDAGRAAIEDYVRRRGMDAEVLAGAAPGLFRVRRRIQGAPLVSIVIPTAGRLRQTRTGTSDLLASAIRSITQKTAYTNYELVIVADEAGVQPTTARALEATRHRILQLAPEGPFNFSRKVNAGVAASTGAHVVLFNDDVEVSASEWLSAMLEYSQDPAIGAVGAKLLYPDGRLQHVGLVLGVGGVAAHALHQHPGSSPGYASGAVCVRNYSAVTAACLMSRRAVFDEVGGFDEAFPSDFNDVDYCLRVRQAGYRIVFTPYAQLYHHESASFGARVQDPAGIEEMQRRWGAVLVNDPYYNPNLTRDHVDFRIRV